MTVDEIFDAVARRMVRGQAGLEQGRIFHSVGLKTAAGRFCAFVNNGDLVVKLPAERVQEL